MIWTESESKLLQFLNHCNQFHPTIKFTMEYSKDSVNFLDTTVIREPDGKITFDLYNKPTDKHCYLHYTSNHPDHTKQAGPYSQLLRIRRICTHNIDFERHANNLIQHYTRRGYPKHILINHLERCKTHSRQSLLHPTRTNTQTPNRLPLVTTFDRGLQPIYAAIRTLWPILQP